MESYFQRVGPLIQTAVQSNEIGAFLILLQGHATDNSAQRRKKNCHGK